ncbi:MAG: hypothetical protein B0W54_11285 [Cellvibrio sp. 79]|nr:MAG: hypothetical protein B0W54_11285 [Cellvibrio sp. 79]
MAFLFMRRILIKYAVTALLIAISFWFYFQLSAYPYKVARWFQPIEAKLVLISAKKCSAGSEWLGLFVDHAVTNQGAYSAQVAFLSGNNMSHHCEIGYKKELLGEQINPSSRYRYASTSKLITASAILKLVALGKIKLEDKLVSFFPELAEFSDARISQITIAQLLNHSAGFNRTLNGDPMFLRSNKPWCPKNLKELQTLRLAFSPGEEQIYSNMGYCLLGEVIHRVTGESYRNYIEKKYSLARRDIKFVNNYYYDDEVKYDYRYEESYSDSYLTLFDFDAVSAAAGLSGSATALAELLWDIQHGDVASPFEWVAHHDKCNVRKVDECLSLGVRHYQPENDDIILHYHEGYLPGSASFAVVDSFGGVTVLLKSGANRYQENPENEWVRWVYKRLSLYYVMQGKLPILNAVSFHH